MSMIVRRAPAVFQQSFSRLIFSRSLYIKSLLSHQHKTNQYAVRVFFSTELQKEKDTLATTDSHTRQGELESLRQKVQLFEENSKQQEEIIKEQQKQIMNLKFRVAKIAEENVQHGEQAKKRWNTNFRFIAVLTLGLGWLAATYNYCQKDPGHELCDRVDKSMAKIFGFIPRRKIYSVPQPSPNTVLRNSFLEKIHELLFLNKEREYQVLVITGSAGSGKTELAIQYASRHSNYYQHEIFIQATDLEVTYRQLARSLGALSRELSVSEPIESVIHEVHAAISSSSKHKSLIIFDDMAPNYVEEMLKSHPIHNAHILVTSTYYDTWLPKVILSDGLALKEGIQLLKQYSKTPDFDQRSAATLVQLLGYSPLAISQAGSYISRTSISIDQYINLFEKNKIELLSQKEAELPYRQNNIITNFRIALRQLREFDPSTLSFLLLCAYLPTKNIPKDLLLTFSDGDPVKLEEYLRTLRPLIHIEEQSISMHSLLQEVVMKEFPLPKDILSPKLASIPQKFDPFLENDPYKAITVYEARKSTIEDKQGRLEVLNKIAPLYLSTGQLEKSLESARQAYELAEELGRSLSPHNSVIALNNIGSAYQALGQMKQATYFLEKAHRINMDFHEESDPELIDSLIRLGSVYQAQKDLEKAIRYFDQAFFNLNKYGKEMDPRRGRVLNYLGNAYQARGELGRAISCFGEALYINEKLYKEEPHADLAQSAFNLGRVYYKVGEKGRAMRYLTNALEMNRILYKDNPHPLHAINLFYVGKVFLDMGNTASALDCFERAYDIDTSIYGKEHPITAKVLRQLGLLYQRNENHERAIDYFRQAYQIDNKVLGVNHTKTKTDCRLIADAYYALGKPEEARKYDKQTRTRL